MSRSIERKVRWNFSGGLVTEANNLAYPENALLTALNVTVNKDGSVQRRKGLRRFGATDLLFNQYSTIPQPVSIDSMFYWRSKDIIVFTVANTIRWHSFETGFSGTLPLSPGVNQDDILAVDFTEVQGRLVGVIVYSETSTSNPPPSFVMQWSGTNSGSPISVRERDLEVITSLINTRQTTVTPEVEYTLFNAGWKQARLSISTPGGVVSTTTTMFARWTTDRSDYPSPADDWLKYINSSGQFDVNMVPRALPGTGQTPIGRQIVDPLFIDRNATIVGAPNTSANRKSFTCVESFAGRLFYSGVESSLYYGKIWYSQVLNGPENYGRCYQRNDPTSETVRTLLAVDGGVINIPNAGQIVKLESYQTGLIVFATRGIWVIAGVNNAPFSATSYSVTKISNTRLSNKNSVVSVKEQPYFLTNNNVWRILLVDGTYIVENISDGKIKSFLEKNNFPDMTKASGVYHEEENRIYWMVGREALVFDVEMGAYWQWTFETRVVGPLGQVNYGVIFGAAYRGTENAGTLAILMALEDNFNGTDVPTNWMTRYFLYELLPPDVRGVCDDAYNVSASGNIFTEFDATFSSIAVAGYTMDGSEGLNKQDNYATFFVSTDSFDTLTTPSCFISGFWDYGLTTGAAQNSQQILTKPIELNLDATPKVTTIIRKLKFRGWGKSLQIRILNDGNRPFKIEGWTTETTKNGRV